MSDELQPVVINLNANKEETINESWLAMFGGAIEMILKQMFGGNTRGCKWVKSVHAVQGHCPPRWLHSEMPLAKKSATWKHFLKYGSQRPSIVFFQGKI